MIVNKPIFKDPALVDAQTRHRRRAEKEIAKTPQDWCWNFDAPTPVETWKQIGAYYCGRTKGEASPEKYSAAGPTFGQAEKDGALSDVAVWAAVSEAGFEYLPQNVSVGGYAASMGGFYLPAHSQVTPLQGVGLGVHNEGTPHYGVVSSTGKRSQRGASDLHGGARSAKPPSGEGLDRIFDLEKAVLLAEYDWENAKGAKKKQARSKLNSARHKLELAKSERANRGLMHAARSYESHVGKSSYGKATAEKLKAEGGRKDYR